VAGQRIAGAVTVTPTDTSAGVGIVTDAATTIEASVEPTETAVGVGTVETTAMPVATAEADPDTVRAGKDVVQETVAGVTVALEDAVTVGVPTST